MGVVGFSIILPYNTPIMNEIAILLDFFVVP